MIANQGKFSNEIGDSSFQKLVAFARYNDVNVDSIISQNYIHAVSVGIYNDVVMLQDEPISITITSSNDMNFKDDIQFLNIEQPNENFDYLKALPIPKTENFGVDYFKHMKNQYEDYHASFKIGSTENEIVAFFTGGYIAAVPSDLQVDIYVNKFENLLNCMIFIPDAFIGTGIKKTEPSQTLVFMESNACTQKEKNFERYMSFEHMSGYKYNSPDPDNLSILKIRKTNHHKTELEIQTKFTEYVFGIHGFDFMNQTFEFDWNIMYNYLPRMIWHEMNKALAVSTNFEDIVTHLYAVFMGKSPFLSETLHMWEYLTEYLGLGEGVFLVRRASNKFLHVSIFKRGYAYS